MTPRFKRQVLSKRISAALSTGLCLSTFIAGTSHAQSLDQAISEQLGSPAGAGPCSVLLGNGANLTGTLLNHCARAIPAGASTSSSGGGSTTASTPISESTFQDNVLKNTDSKLFKNWSWFATIDSQSLEKSESESEAAFESNAQRLLAGLSYAPSTDLNVSLVINRNTQEGDFDNGGYFESESTGIRFLTSFQSSEKLSFMVSGVYDDVNNDRARVSRVSDTFNGSEINVLSSTVASSNNYAQLGLNTRIHYELISNKFTLTPFVGFDYLSTDNGTYTEQGTSGLELTFHDESVSSLQSAVGVQGSYAITGGYGVFIPQFSATWRHEFEAESRNVNVSFAQDQNSTQFDYQTDALDSDFIYLNLGGVFIFPKGIQAFANVETLIEHDYYESVNASLGLRVEL